MPKLVINSPSGKPIEYELKPGLNNLGRGFNTDFRVDDPSVSALHAEIVVEPNSITVKDLRSTNGTFINRSQIREGFLHPGHVLGLGAVELLFVADVTEEADSPSSAVARTVALPQIGGIKIARPTAPSGGMRMPGSYPVPMAPAPALTTAPTSLRPTASPQPAPRPAPTPVPPPAPVFNAPEDRTWKQVPTPVAEEIGLARCLGFGFGAAILSAAVWIAVAAMAGINPAPVAMAATGLFCGLALMLARRNHSGAGFALLAVGFAMLGAFIGGLGQVLVLQKISFHDFNLAGLLAGILCAALIGGLRLGQKSTRRTRLA